MGDLLVLGRGLLPAIEIRQGSSVGNLLANLLPLKNNVLNMLLRRRISPMNDIDLINDDYTMMNWSPNRIHSDKFPYVVVRIISATYSIVAVPEKIASNIPELIEWAKIFVHQNGLDSCLVINERKCYYFTSNGDVSESGEVPAGGAILNWQRIQDGSFTLMSV